ncbi:MAG: hypothetical protein Q7T20_19330 [Saprospiraceae bacterium]|nr:hypothetical protein [Saprospiraceae bacterium]
MESMQNSNHDHHTEESAVESNATALEVLSKEKHERRFKRGIKWMGVGALTLVLSFGVNFLCFQCAVDFHTPMYVMTSLGALSLLKGMIDIF